LNTLPLTAAFLTHWCVTDPTDILIKVTYPSRRNVAMNIRNYVSFIVVIIEMSASAKLINPFEMSEQSLFNP